MNGAGCRRKGHDFERAVARRFAAVFGNDTVRRGLQYRDGTECPDVVAPGFWVECKAGRRTNPRAALAQAVACSAGKTERPLAVCKDDRDPAFVVLRLDDFLALFAEGRASA